MLKSFLQSFQILQEADIEDFILQTTPRTLEKSDFLIREGETSKEVVFLLSGIFRSYYLAENGDEITYCFSFPGTMMTAYSSFITGLPSVENIQAITPTQFLSISKDKIKAMEQNNPSWIRFLKIAAEQNYIYLEKRFFQMQKNNASQRYHMLTKDQPEYLQQIPLQYLASYLGITQRHLSRIRKEVYF
ncbi:Crp/Fnr family transcriptional regulator [Algoriphagus sp.]|uniref:Crp/Fnr family transcriptional regulator n=1 Tax=Algoriphagus sp. TaxID=1872435 RepID=UPI003291003A